jgi:malate dehydrogenase (quinone)
MSATLGTLLNQLEPTWNIHIFERLSEVALESSNPWNNAGTGHSALCELNYTPERDDGTIDISSAVKVNEQFQISRQFWAHLLTVGALPDPRAFINSTPHMSFVFGEENVEYLRKRYEALKDHPLFAGMEFSTDASVIRGWAPLLIPGRRKDEPIAATHMNAGTDVDFGALTKLLFDYLTSNGAELVLEESVQKIKKHKGVWRISTRHTVGNTPETYDAKFVFVGAGGYALGLLQKSGIKEIRGYGGFPVSGEFLRSDNQDLVKRHQAKVYGKAGPDAPPMSVPHLDTRFVDGQGSLMFGPYAGFSPKFLKSGSPFDLIRSIRWHNLVPMIAAGASNLSLVRYLVGQLIALPSTKFEELLAFYPDADPADWYKITAGQRVQVIKRDREKGTWIQFGTEVVAAGDGSIAGLLGASPGASTAVPIMLGLVEKCFPDRMDAWRPKLVDMVPTYGEQLSDDEKRAAKTIATTATALEIAP